MLRIFFNETRSIVVRKTPHRYGNSRAIWEWQCPQSTNIQHTAQYRRLTRNEKEKPRCNGASQTPPCHPWWRTRLVAAPVNQSINQSRFFSGLSNLNHCEVHYSARRKNCCSRNVFKWRLNDCNVEAETVCSGRGTTRRLVPAERRALRSGTSTVEVSGPRYRGALLWTTLYVSTAILNWIRSSTRSQCKLIVVWENHRRPQETTGDPNRPQES